MAITGDNGNNVLDGTKGNDLIKGLDGDDSLNGKDGHDTLIGMEGNDTLLGNIGNDTVDGKQGADVLSGGAGFDSADYRFEAGWYYGLPELTRERYRGERRISNPGCYATAMQLALAPVAELLDGPAQCFGVSGYSVPARPRATRTIPRSCATT